MGLISDLLNPAKMVEGAVGSLLGGASGSGGDNPLSMIESLFGGDSIGSSQSSSGSGDSSLSGLMSIASLAAMFV